MKSELFYHKGDSLDLGESRENGNSPEPILGLGSRALTPFRVYEKDKGVNGIEVHLVCNIISSHTLSRA